MGLASPQGIRPQKSENQKAMIIQGRPLTNYAYPKRASASLRFFYSLAARAANNRLASSGGRSDGCSFSVCSAGKDWLFCRK